jgi:hypothetical protein
MSTYYWLRKPIPLKHVIGEWTYHENNDGDPALTEMAQASLPSIFWPRARPATNGALKASHVYAGNHVGNLPTLLDAKSEHQMSDADYRLAARRWRDAKKRAATRKGERNEDATIYRRIIGCRKCGQASEQGPWWQTFS